jgi:tripartite-type tricarboxylate transporter receptor subunit TctC
VIAPPDLPADRLQALKDAFMATMRDPAFLRDAQRQGLEINASAGEAVAAKIARFFSYSPTVIATAAHAVRTR